MSSICEIVTSSSSASRSGAGRSTARPSAAEKAAVASAVAARSEVAAASNVAQGVPSRDAGIFVSGVAASVRRFVPSWKVRDDASG